MLYYIYRNNRIRIDSDPNYNKGGEGVNIKLAEIGSLIN